MVKIKRNEHHFSTIGKIMVLFPDVVVFVFDVVVVVVPSP